MFKKLIRLLPTQQRCLVQYRNAEGLLVHCEQKAIPGMKWCLDHQAERWRELLRSSGTKPPSP